MRQPEIVDRQFLIIGGASKAGTTSLYHFLAAHPDVCASSIKESRFFLDERYPLPRQCGLPDGIIRYADFFADDERGRHDRIYVEATPDYLYCQTPKRILDFLPRAKFVFILRNPVDRLVSWYRYGKQLGLLKETIGFDDYCRRQLATSANEQTPVEWRVLEQGRYAHYLSDWFSEVAAAATKVVLFDELTATPSVVLRDIGKFAGLDTRYFDNFDFAAHNITLASRSTSLARSYNWLRRMLAYKFLRRPVVWKTLQTANRGVKRLMSFNQRQADPVQIGTALHAELHSYYADDTSALEALIGRSLESWKK